MIFMTPIPPVPETGRNLRLTQIVCLLLVWLGISSMTSSTLFAQVAQPEQPGIFQQYILQQKTEKAFREEVVSCSHDVIERVKLVCQLDPAQLENLQLAAEGDVVRFYREFERIKSEVKGITADDAQAWQKAWPIISPLYQRVQQGIFDDSSLCHFVLNTTLNPDQLKQFQTAEAKRRDYAFKANCKTTIAELSREIPLTSGQREKLLSIMISVGRPKKSHPQLEGMVGMVILEKAGKRIEDESGLDKKQRDHLVKLLEQARGMEGNFEW
jgi:hypothetical protein